MGVSEQIYPHAIPKSQYWKRWNSPELNTPEVREPSSSASLSGHALCQQEGEHVDNAGRLRLSDIDEVVLLDPI